MKYQIKLVSLIDKNGFEYVAVLAFENFFWDSWGSGLSGPQARNLKFSSEQKCKIGQEKDLF